MGCPPIWPSTLLLKWKMAKSDPLGSSLIVCSLCVVTIRARHISRSFGFGVDHAKSHCTLEFVGGRRCMKLFPFHLWTLLWDLWLIFITIQGRGKVIISIDTIESRGCDWELSYCLKSAMYKNSHEVRIFVLVEEK